uniref:uncharacterized protein n=1 Tax=Pristiophorus japonicus TaxID=55135 RepID=UPI00398F8A7E
MRFNTRKGIERGRTKRDILEMLGTGYAAGLATVNTIDLYAIDDRVNTLTQILRGVLGRDMDNQVLQARLGDGAEGERLQVAHTLQKHAKTINLIHAMGNAISKRLQAEIVCSGYGAWILSEVQHNLEQLQNGDIPDWIPNSILNNWTLDKKVNNTCEVRRNSHARVPKFRCITGRVNMIRFVLSIPQYDVTKGDPLYQIDNIGEVRNQTRLRYHQPARWAIKVNNSTRGIAITDCYKNNQVVLCRDRATNDECGFHQINGCMLSITPLKHDLETIAAPQGNGEWCVSTGAANLTIKTRGGVTPCPH